MKLDLAAAETLQALRRANGASFAELVEIAGLDPARDFRDTDLSNVDFTGSDLSGYDFSGAKLSNASFVGAYNYDSAVFARAEMDGVTWSGSWRPDQGVRLRRTSPPLNGIQQKILEVLLKTLGSRPSARAVAMLPTGIGKSAILVEIFRKLTRTKTFARGLILCETVAERNQLIHLLQNREIIIANIDYSRKFGAINRGETLVLTYGSYLRMQKELERSTKMEGNPLKCTHVALMSLTSLSSRGRMAITRMAEAKAPPAMLAFIEALAERSSGEDWLKRTRLNTVFKSVTYQYTIGQAVADGLLVMSELVDRSHADYKVADHGDKSNERALALMEKIANDYLMEIDRTSNPLPALLIVPDDANAELLAHELDLQLVRASERLDKPPSVEVLTVQGLRSGHAMPLRGGVVAISKPAAAKGLDLREFGSVGLLTGLPERLATKLMFTPARRVGADRVRVLDYVGTLSEVAR